VSHFAVQSAPAGVGSSDAGEDGDASSAYEVAARRAVGRSAKSFMLIFLWVLSTAGEEVERCRLYFPIHHHVPIYLIATNFSTIMRSVLLINSVAHETFRVHVPPSILTAGNVTGLAPTRHERDRLKEHGGECSTAS
jgi:hypothetical protein